jgi:uncharacterized protein (TIGR02391 family)
VNRLGWSLAPERETLGGKTPRLKVNRLQTESEQNVQKGIEALLRGIYQAIRNPRSHGRHADEEKDMVAIILFSGSFSQLSQTNSR